MKTILFLSSLVIFFLCPLYGGDSGTLAVGEGKTISIPDEKLDLQIRSYLTKISKDSIGGYMQSLVDFKTRFMLAENRRDVAMWIKGKFESFGLFDVAIDSFQNTLEYPLRSGKMNTAWHYNVVAALKGVNNTDTIQIIGAHYDCFIMGIDADPYVFSPGANNNASGVAVCLEIARVLQGEGYRPRYTINFVAFGAEEFMTMLAEGKTGSENYVQGLKKSGKYVSMMIDNNQISYHPDSAQWKLDFQKCPGSEKVTCLAHLISERYTRITPVDTTDHINFSDVYYFWSNGFPAIFLEEFYFCPYTFTGQDILQNCDTEYCAEVAKISLGMLLYSNF